MRASDYDDVRRRRDFGNRLRGNDKDRLQVQQDANASIVKNAFDVPAIETCQQSFCSDSIQNHSQFNHARIDIKIWSFSSRGYTDLNLMCPTTFHDLEYCGLKEFLFRHAARRSLVNSMIVTGVSASTPTSNHSHASCEGISKTGRANGRVTTVT